MTGPTNDKWDAEPALPGFTFLALERSDAAIREGDCLGPVVGRERDNRVVQLAYVLKFLED